MSTPSLWLPKRLSERLGRELVVAVAEVLESESSVIRARAEPAPPGLPAEMVVKYVSDVRFDRPDHTGPPARFLNEWAALEFLTEAGVAPELLAGDVGRGLIVIEDLGDLPSLETLLLSDDGPGAHRGLVEMGRLLGELHGSGRGREPEFDDLQAIRHTQSPLSDSTIDQRGRRDPFTAAMERMSVGPSGRFWDEVVEMEALIHDDSPLRTLIHADAGPQNVLLAGTRSRLIDFEFAVYGNAMCDLVGARLGFPQTMATGRVPHDEVVALESAYRLGVASRLPAIEDTRLFARHVTAAAGHWALNRWASAWRRHLEPEVASERSDGVLGSAVSETLLVLDGFVDTARRSNEFEVVADAVDQFVVAISSRWPELRPPPTYPALRNQ